MDRLRTCENCTPFPCPSDADCTSEPGWSRVLTPSADVPACRDEDPAQAAALAAAYPDPPDYQHPEDD